MPSLVSRCQGAISPVLRISTMVNPASFANFSTRERCGAGKEFPVLRARGRSTLVLPLLNPKASSTGVQPWWAFSDNPTGALVSASLFLIGKSMTISPKVLETLRERRKSVRAGGGAESSRRATGKACSGRASVWLCCSMPTPFRKAAPISVTTGSPSAWATRIFRPTG